MLRFVADENFNGAIVRGLRRRRPALDLVRLQDVGLSGINDPDLLAWAAREQRVILTHDVATLREYAENRVRAGLPMPGVFEVSEHLSSARPLRICCWSPNAARRESGKDKYASFLCAEAKLPFLQFIAEKRDWFGVSAVQYVRILAGREDFSTPILLPLPTTKEWGEDRGEGQFIFVQTNAPPLPSPLLHPMEVCVRACFKNVAAEVTRRILQRKCGQMSASLPRRLPERQISKHALSVVA